MKSIRRVHLWLGTLFAPSILFFAFSGTLQMCGLHEGTDAVGWIARLAMIHKDQINAAPRAKPPRPAPPPGAEAKPAAPPSETHDAGPTPSTPLKAFFLAMALGLMISTGLGIYVALGMKRDRRIAVALLVAGTLLPLGFLFL